MNNKNLSFEEIISSISDKQLLLHLLFKQITLKEGDVECTPNQPFSFIIGENRLKSITKDKIAKNESCELQEYQGLDSDFDDIASTLKNTPFESQITIKKTRG